MLEKLGYDGICTRPQHATEEFLAAMDRHGIRIVATYGNNDCRSFTDFRETLDEQGLDAVMISTPDHWHAIQALAALKKGLHVCCEKAMTCYFDEGRALADMAKKSGLVFRLDSECRSHGYMVKTADLAHYGYLGTIRRFEIGVPQEIGNGFGDATPMPVPAHLDYEMWLGPAPVRPYTLDRVHHTDLKTGAPVGRPGKILEWNPVKEAVTNDADALAGFKGIYREPWELKNFIE